MPKLPLYIENASPGDGASSQWNPPAISLRKSSAAAPAPQWYEAAFDAARTEGLFWRVKMPDDYTGSLTLKGVFKMASAVTDEVVLEGRIAAYTVDTDTSDLDAKAFGSANNATVTVPTTTAGKPKTFTITLTNADSVAAGDEVFVGFARVGGDAADDAAGDMELLSIWLEYS